MSEIIPQARSLAKRLNARHVDVNELEKVLAYARQVRDTAKVRELIDRLARLNVIVYSRQTKRYAREIQEIVKPALPSDARQALLLLGWTVRLMRYDRAVSRRRRQELP